MSIVLGVENSLGNILYSPFMVLIMSGLSVTSESKMEWKLIFFLFASFIICFVKFAIRSSAHWPLPPRVYTSSPTRITKLKTKHVDAVFNIAFQPETLVSLRNMRDLQTDIQFIGLTEIISPDIIDEWKNGELVEIK